MPHFGLSRQDAVDITTALLASSKPASTFTPARDFEKQGNKSKSKDKNPPRTQPDAQAGRTVVLTRGCIACHSLSSEKIGVRDEEDEANSAEEARRDYFTYKLFAGGDLSGIGNKRPGDFFSRWLARPETIQPNHRMPTASLTDLEREDAALYLASLRHDATMPEPPPGDAQRGAKLIQQHRCASCHKLPETLASQRFEKLPLSSSSRWDSGCLASADPARSVPGFELTAGQRRALKVYWTNGAKDTRDTDLASSRIGAELLMAESNCFACHARKNHNGLAWRAMQVIEHDRDLSARLPAMLAPSLNGVGDKLHDAALANAVARKAPAHRPWLDIRMPKYPLSDSQIESLVQAFVRSDRMPAIDESTGQSLTPTAQSNGFDYRGRRHCDPAAAGRLVTSEGFG